MKNFKIKSEKGITLLSLAVTLVVLIILTSISINILLGKNGIITKAKNAREEYQIAQQNEQIDLKKLEAIIEWREKGLTSIEIGETAVDGNKIYIDSNGDTAVIPRGFTVSGVIDEYTITDGLVIYDLEGDTVEKWDIDNDNDGIVDIKKSSYNQWVWIPVTNPSEMYIEDETGWDLLEGINTRRKTTIIPSELINMDTSDAETYQEPGILHNTDFDNNNSTNLTDAGFSNWSEMAQTLIDDYNEMLASVEKYKGFYIGRYEIGGTLSTPVEQAGIVLNNTNWYNLYSACKKLGTENNEIETRMIWGNQWDEVCKFLANSGYDLTNSASYGNYLDSTGNAGINSGTNNFNNTTGRNEYWKVNNIYDIAGNCWEWVQATFKGNRAMRGRFF